MPTERRIAITGMSINTPLGDTLGGFLEGLLAGRSAITRWKTLDDHPRKEWPLAECEPEAMLSVLEEFRHAAATGHEASSNGVSAQHVGMRA